MVQVFQYLLIPPVVWTVGEYASLPDGRLVHTSPLRDAFVLASGAFLVLALFGHLAMAKLIRERWRRPDAA